MKLFDEVFCDLKLAVTLYSRNVLSNSKSSIRIDQRSVKISKFNMYLSIEIKENISNTLL